MKLEVGMYVRINTNFRKICIGIGKIKDIVQDTIYVNMNTNLPISFNLTDIIKASYNIIDLIEIGDIVKYNDEDCYGDHILIEDVDYNLLERLKNDIQCHLLAILTKEQFENNCYKIGNE